MPYVAPGSTIRLYHGVPLDNTYRHTTYKTSEAEQLSDLNSYYTPTVYTNYSYIRVTDGNDRIRIGLNTPAGSDIYTVNYCVFNNAAFENKNWFCFVLSVTYLNNLTYELEIEVDVMQTFMRSYDLDYCLVDRCHTITDEVGDNIIPENIDIGYYVTSQQTQVGLMNDYRILEFEAATTGAGTNSGFIQGLYNPIDCYVYDVNGNAISAPATTLAERLVTLTNNNRADTVLAIVYYPTQLVGMSPTNVEINHQLTNTYPPTSVDGYTPKNNKLYTYPYTCLMVHNGAGSSITLAFERFSNTSSIYFNIQGAQCTTPEVTCIPLGYAKESHAYHLALTINQFPQIPYIIDAYRAWVAGGGSARTAIGTVGSVVSMVGGLALMATGVGAMAGASMALAGGAGFAKQMQSLAEAQNLPPQTNGTLASSSAFANRTLDFYFETRQVNSQQARIIDDFFTQYGYASGQLMIPNRQARPYFTYIKTLQCNAHAISVPGEYMQQIVNIYNNGVTFWDSLLHVGDYALDNAPTSASIAAAGITTGGVKNG